MEEQCFEIVPVDGYDLLSLAARRNATLLVEGVEGQDVLFIMFVFCVIGAKDIWIGQKHRFERQNSM